MVARDPFPVIQVALLGHLPADKDAAEGVEDCVEAALKPLSQVQGSLQSQTCQSMSVSTDM
jgi:hypothetical protein